MTANQNRKQTCPVPNGALVIIGGHENKGEGPEKEIQREHFVRLEVLERFVKECRSDNCRIEVITTASSEGDESFADYQKAFADLNVKQVGHIHHHNRLEALDNKCLERIQKANGVFFSGGSQLKLTSIYGGTDLLTLLKERYIYEELVIGGTSAGAMAMSTPMIFGGAEGSELMSGEVKITTGLEFLKDVCVDTHFVDRGRFVRMAQVIATNPTSVGIGIEENTAIIVRNGIEAEVVGSGIIIIIDGHQLTSSNVEDYEKKPPLSIHDLKVHLLAGGERYIIPQKNPPHQ
jgi:cyanophycinase